MSGSFVVDVNAPTTNDFTATGTLGSDSIGFAAQSGVTTFTFNLTGGYTVDVAEFGTADGLGNVGENTARQRPVGYAASFSGTATDLSSLGVFTLNSTVATGGSTFTLLQHTPLGVSSSTPALLLMSRLTTIRSFLDQDWVMPQSTSLTA